MYMPAGLPWQDAATIWDHLHEQPPFRPLYPNEHVVRFLARDYVSLADKRDKLSKILDIGVGGGRHTKLLCEMGFDAYGLDISMIGLRYTHKLIAEKRWKAGLVRASMNILPFKDGSFDAAVSFGVFYYGSSTEMQAAIHEIHRVLKANGKAFVVLRTTSDYRYGKGDPIGPDTFFIRIRETNEFGTIQHFLSEEAVFKYFSLFSHIWVEKTETTFMERKAVNSDWLITVEK
jgi:ubiquinone/menaquinone biosynthesis C-methylase UbiE